MVIICWPGSKCWNATKPVFRIAANGSISRLWAQQRWLGRKLYTTVGGKGDSGLAASLPTGLKWLVLGVTLIAILSWFTAVHLLGAGLAGFFNGLMPVAAMAIGAATGTVALTPLRVIGTLIVAAGITLGMRASRAQPPKRYRPEGVERWTSWSRS